MRTRTSHIKQGILILGAEPLRPETIAAAADCDEVFILARAVPSDSGWFVDEDRTHRDAQERLDQLRRDLRARRVVVRGMIGDGNPVAARRDAAAICPSGTPLN